MDRGPLIILGASVRAAAQSAIRAGYRPYPIDLFADSDLKHLDPVQIERYPSGFLPALAAAPQAPWMYTGSLENYPRLIARLTKLRPLIGNGPEALRKVRDPFRLAEVVAGTAVKFPLIGSQGAGVRDQDAGVSWLLKPLRSGAGMGIKRVNSCDPTPGHICQQFIPGQNCSASFVAANGHVRWIGAAEQWIGRDWAAPQEFQYAGSLAPLELSESEKTALLEMAERLTQAAGLQGLFGCDFIRNEQGLWLIEVNPRYTASMELFEVLNDRRLLSEHCGSPPLAARQEPRPPDRSGPRGRWTAKLIVYADRPGDCGGELHRVLRRLHEDRIDTADVPRPGTRFEVGNPICTLLSSKHDHERGEMISRLKDAAAVVRRALDS